jgi:hypothetical protein
MAGDTSGNTLGCRTYHAAAAAGAGAATHCTHAGPTGGDLDDGAGGTCGDGCVSFCQIAMVACTGANAQYLGSNGATPFDECYADCSGFAVLKTPPYSTADTATDDFGCRMYHLTVAAEGATQAGTHCKHIVGTLDDGGTSAVCTQ